MDSKAKLIVFVIALVILSASVVYYVELENSTSSNNKVGFKSNGNGASALHLLFNLNDTGKVSSHTEFRVPLNCTKLEIFDWNNGSIGAAVTVLSPLNKPYDSFGLQPGTDVISLYPVPPKVTLTSGEWLINITSKSPMILELKMYAEV